MPVDFMNHCLGCPYEGANHLDDKFSDSEARPLNMEDNGASVLLVFQSPGTEEWRAKRPLASLNRSSAAMRLERAFTKLHLTRQNFNITNAVQCYQGKAASIGGKPSRDDELCETAIKHCAQWLKLDIENHNYARIVVFGAVAKRSVRNLDCFPEAKVIYLHHPSGGLRNEELLAALRAPGHDHDDQ